MDVNRRNLMKGVLTGGTLLALGVPPGAFASAPAGRAERFGLLLGNTSVDVAFAAGFRTAAQYAARGGGVAVSMKDSPEVIKLKGGLLNDYKIVARLLEKSLNTRWVAIMDDGSAAIFTELVRNASGKLISLGSHASADGASIQWGSPDISQLRHVWVTASPAHSAGSILASHLVANESSFSIVENFLSTQASAGSTTANGSVPGFLSYRLEGSDAGHDRGQDLIHLHCSGLSPSSGCELLGWNAAGGWTPVSQREFTQEAAAFIAQVNGQPRSGDWAESVGYAVTVAALGTEAIQESCYSRAFLHRSATLGKRSRRTGAAEQFTSFIIDT